jgi:hypothetical protein
LGYSELIILAQIEVKIPTVKKNNFSYPERTTNGSSFQDLEKYFFLKEDCNAVLD